MTFAELCSIAREELDSTVASLPEEIRKEAGRVPVLLETKPDAGDLERGLDADMLGLFDPGPHDAPHIRLWLENLWDYADHDPTLFREEVHITFLHEIGHLLGWDEDELEERGLG